MPEEFHATDDDMFRETEAAEIMLELAEDGLKDIMKHLKIPTVVFEKGCKLIIELNVSCNPARNKFDINVSRGAKLAPHKGAQTTLYAADSQDGHIDLKEFRQMRLPVE